MPSHRPRLLALALVLLAAGCAEKGTIYKALGLPGGTAVVTSAELRTTNQFRVGAGSRHGTVIPEYITCAEPSPDVAKAVSAALGAGGSLSVSGLPGNVSPEVAFSVSRAHAQSLAQLTERLATIQLLRDGLYRACEAYANGAISETTYSIILSRYDKMMITMLMGELAAGAFGRSLAALGGGAAGAASASLDATDKQARSREAEAQVKAAGQQHGEESKEVVKAQREHIAALKAQASAAARTTHVVAGGGLATGHDADLAKVLHEMQRKYIENLNYDALEVACVSALDRVPLAPAGPAQELTAFGSYCLSGILPALQLNKGKLLQSIVERADAEKKRAQMRLDVDKALQEVSDYAAAVDKLMKSVRPMAAPATTPR